MYFFQFLEDDGQDEPFRFGRSFQDASDFNAVRGCVPPELQTDQRCARILQDLFIFFKMSGASLAVTRMLFSFFHGKSEIRTGAE